MSSRRRRKAAAHEHELLDQLQAQREEIDQLRETAQPRVTPVYIRERSVKKFTNGPDDPPISEWLDSVQRVTRGRSPQNIVDFLMENLDGEAYNEVKHRPFDERSSPKDICYILIQAFGEGHCSRMQRERQFFNRRQREKESLRRFSHALMALAEKIPDIEEERDSLLKEQFAENVRDSELKRELKRLCWNDPDITFYDLREEAIAWAGENDGIEDDFPVKQNAIQQQPTDLEPMQKVVTLLTDLTTALKLKPATDVLDPGSMNPPNMIDSFQSSVQAPHLNGYQAQIYGSYPSRTYLPPPAQLFQHSNSFPQYSSNQHVSPQQGYIRPSTMPQPAFTEDGKPICFRCQKVGHIRRFCRSQPASGQNGNFTRQPTSAINGGQPHQHNFNGASTSFNMLPTGNQTGGYAYGMPLPGTSPQNIPRHQNMVPTRFPQYPGMMQSPSFQMPATFPTPNHQAGTSGTYQGNGRPQSW